jgi:hypothetical protein
LFLWAGYAYRKLEMLNFPNWTSPVWWVHHLSLFSFYWIINFNVNNLFSYTMSLFSSSLYYELQRGFHIWLHSFMEWFLNFLTIGANLKWLIAN